mmetsp:Transcript_35712/g.112748  ORF Transcript_35712/g.112748 Transcript_35712/m.112748 type:complete len:100 (-) Transcript_35712:499-798(-)|eukprot:CAMPEP_0182901478 /NCGR_PEP_ID=MMETSP0034_2-20130328/29685_1 /TAXON_ID=156128 /ORGANISM="Nephroselmis pyriformis, Strain CCMP717" /LENGTH=99 /DNA_ID=CAMNT_0025035901 /DNA_START=39 /DNA_END=338 /DNA_ORIENTATION=-
MDWSCKCMMQETLRNLQKTELDLAINLDTIKAYIHHALQEWDKQQNKCNRCWGKGVTKCVLCRGKGNLNLQPSESESACSRCLGSCLEQCPECVGYGLT